MLGGATPNWASWAVTGRRVGCCRPGIAEAHVEGIRRKLRVHSPARIAAWVTGQRLRRGASR